MPKKTEYHTRICPKCGVEIIDVRDAFTGATYPVEAAFDIIPGVTLGPQPPGRKRNPEAARADVFYPHLPLCKPDGRVRNGEDNEEPVAEDDVGEGVPGVPKHWPAEEPELDIEEDDGRPG